MRGLDCSAERRGICSPPFQFPVTRGQREFREGGVERTGTGGSGRARDGESGLIIVRNLDCLENCDPPLPVVMRRRLR